MLKPRVRADAASINEFDAVGSFKTSPQGNCARAPFLIFSYLYVRI